MRDII